MRRTPQKNAAPALSVRLSTVSLLGVILLISQAAHAAPPNVLIILADDGTFSDLPSYGGVNAKTPYIDRLASQGSNPTMTVLFLLSAVKRLRCVQAVRVLYGVQLVNLSRRERARRTGVDERIFAAISARRL